MALIPNINACVGNGCATLIINETTGIYNPESNLFGYGPENIEIGNVTETHILITLPDGVTVIDITNPVGLPTTDEEFDYIIEAATLDPTRTTIEDGLYLIEYTVTDGIDVYTSEPIPFLFLCNSFCCVSKLFAKIATVRDCDCDSATIKNALYAWGLYKGLEANGNCGNATAIANTLAKLNRICNSTGSACGC